MGKELHVLSITRSPARFILNLVGLSARLSPFLSPSVWVVVLQGFGNLVGQGPKKDAAAIANANSTKVDAQFWQYNAPHPGKGGVDSLPTASRERRRGGWNVRNHQA